MRGKSVGMILLGNKKELGYTCEVNGLPSEAYPTLSDLLFSLLDKTKIKTIYGVVVPDYKESLRNLWGCCKVNNYGSESYDFRFAPSPGCRKFRT
jgi:hypothetical protein